MSNINQIELNGTTYDLEDVLARASALSGQPIAVTLASAMTNTDKIYLYLGNEVGYDYGYIYVYTDGAWTATSLYGKGEDGVNGYSPTVTLTEVSDGVSISVTDKNGTTTATVQNGTATDEQVSAWLDEHPEATTTVQDDSITEAKLANDVKEKIDICSPSNDGLIWASEDIDWTYEHFTSANADIGASGANYDLSEPLDCTAYDYVYFYSKRYADRSSGRFVVGFYDANGNHVSHGNGIAVANAINDPVAVNSKILEAYAVPSGATNIRIVTYSDERAKAYFNTVQIRNTWILPSEGSALKSAIALPTIDAYNISQFTKGNLIDPSQIFSVQTNAIPFFDRANFKKSVNAIFEIDPTKKMYIRTPAKGTTNIYHLYATVVQFYDENGAFLSELVGDTSTTSHGTRKLDFKDEYGLFEITFTNVAKYVTVRFNGSYFDETKKDEVILSYNPIPIDAGSNYKAIDSDLLKDYVNDLAQQKIEENLYYRFQKLGKLIPTPEYTYNCHMQELLKYDSSTNKYVAVMRATQNYTHAEAGTRRGYFVTIDAETLKASTPTEITFGGSTLSWPCGFFIDGSGNYVVLGYSTTDSTVLRIISTDKGATWSSQGAVTVTDSDTSTYKTSQGITYSPSNPSANFFSVHRLNSGRILATYDDTVVGTNFQTSSSVYTTKIAYSDDNGATFSVITLQGGEFATVEQAFLEFDGKVMMIARQDYYPSTKAPAYISYSHDDGLTWSKIVASRSITMHCSDACGFVHDGIVEVFAITRYTNSSWYHNSRYSAGELVHYSATFEEALNDEFLIREIFYSDANRQQDFTAPALAVDGENNVLVVYPESEKGNSLPTSWNFLYGNQSGQREVCCDGIASDVLPYSGKKVKELYDDLLSRINALS